MVRIRLKRLGAKKAPFYRIVVADQRTSRKGAQLSDTARALLVKAGVIE